jgi:hypothetical protein
MVDLHDESLGQHLGRGVDLVEGAHHASGDAGAAEQRHELIGRVRGEGILDEPGRSVPVGGTLGVGGQAGQGGIDAEGGAEPLPQSLAADADLDRAALAAEQAVRRDRRVVVALRVRHLARDRVPAGPS